MILYITRHGQVIAKGDFVEKDADFLRGDPSLTALGRRQAELLGRRLKELNFNGLIYSSPYSRTMETSQIIAEITHSIIIPFKQIREILKREGIMDGFNGLTINQLKSRFSCVHPDAELEYPWWTTEAESDDDVLARVSPLIDNITAKNGDALVVGHVRTAAAAHRHLVKKFGGGERNLTDSWNCNLTAIRINPGFEVVYRGDVSHIPTDMISANARMKLNAACME